MENEPDPPEPPHAPGSLAKADASVAKDILLKVYENTKLDVRSIRTRMQTHTRYGLTLLFAITGYAIERRPETPASLWAPSGLFALCLMGIIQAQSNDLAGCKSILANIEEALGLHAKDANLLIGRALYPQSFDSSTLRRPSRTGLTYQLMLVFAIVCVLVSSMWGDSRRPTTFAGALQTEGATGAEGIESRALPSSQGSR